MFTHIPCPPPHTHTHNSGLNRRDFILLHKSGEQQTRAGLTAGSATTIKIQATSRFLFYHTMDTHLILMIQDGTPANLPTF